MLVLCPLFFIDLVLQPKLKAKYSKGAIRRGGLFEGGDSRIYGST